MGASCHASPWPAVSRSPRARMERFEAFDIATGALRWQYDARTPFFAPPAVASHTVYAADLKGVIHALTLERGRSYGSWISIGIRRS